MPEEEYEEYEKLDLEPHSVFQELAIINFLEPDGNILSNTLLALNVVFSKQYIDIEQAALKHYGSEVKIPRPYFVLVFGKDIDAGISFGIPEGLVRWMDSGAVEMWQFGA